VSNLDEARRAAEERLAWSRRQAEERLAEMRSAVESRIGVVPRNATLLFVVLAGAAGFALALRRRRRLPGAERRERRLRQSRGGSD
jgi:hypothetical protein